jgi:hypothetical protein
MKAYADETKSLKEVRFSKIRIVCVKTNVPQPRVTRGCRESRTDTILALRELLRHRESRTAPRGDEADAGCGQQKLLMLLRIERTVVS